MVEASDEDILYHLNIRKTQLLDLLMEWRPHVMSMGGAYEMSVGWGPSWEDEVERRAFLFEGHWDGKQPVRQERTQDVQEDLEFELQNDDEDAYDGDEGDAALVEEVEAVAEQGAFAGERNDDFSLVELAAVLDLQESPRKRGKRRRDE